MSHRSFRSIAQERAIVFVGTALFPGIAYRLRWPTRLGPRGLLLYIAANTAFLAAVRTLAAIYTEVRHADEEAPG